jgi:Tetratricopeptide repeat
MRAGILMTLLTPVLLATAQQDNVAERQLQAAIYKQEVVGDLRSAIELYKSLAARSGSNREVAAAALFRMGECQERLGQSEAARNTYERVVRQFGDQLRIRAQARRKLEDLTPQNEQDERPSFGVGTATFPVDAAAGKHVKFSGYIRTEAVTEGWAGLWWRVDGEPGSVPLAFDNMQDRVARGTTPWTRYEIELDVPAGAKHIDFGVIHAGNGTAWFDTLQVQLNGLVYADNGNFDLDFESNWPRGFYAGGKGYKVELDKELAHTGRQSLRSQLVGLKTGQTVGAASFGFATSKFPVSAVAGKHVKYSGYIKTESVGDGWAGLWWRVDGDPGSAPLAFDNMQDRGATGTSPWTLYQIELDVPASARNIDFGVLHVGGGTAWFDSLQVEIDGVVYTDTSRFDLDFESGSPAPRGFFVGGNGYRLGLDKEVAHSGKQSLRSQPVAIGKQHDFAGQTH